MKIKTTLYLILILVITSCSSRFNDDVYDGSGKNELVLWYTEPAEDWESEALPIGNGRLGGMFFGGVEEECIQFNDITLWTGSPTERGSYQNFGHLCMHFSEINPVTDYRRELNIENAIGTVSFKAGDTLYERTYFCSYPDQVMVVHLKSSVPGSINLSIDLNDAHEGTKVVENNTIRISGKLTVLSYEISARIKTVGGNTEDSHGSVVIKNADEVTILLAGGTDYDPVSPNYVKKNFLKDEFSEKLQKASGRTFEELKKRHVKDYRTLFTRVSLDLNSDKTDLPTDSLLEDYKRGNYNKSLEELYFQYGRYLMISCSREDTKTPSNLQGLWNNNNSPPWQCDIHSNINVQMNYWPVEVTNLSECHLPYLNYIYNQAIVQPYWQQMAASQECRGWTMRTENNIFGHSQWNWNNPANAWYCMHPWQHYKFTMDQEFLWKTAYPVMKSACQFWFDRLVKNENGNWVAPQEWSPEHGPWEDGVAYAQQLIWDLFSNTLEACEILNIDSEFKDSLAHKLEKLDPGLYIGSWGQIKEWTETEDDPENHHRHISHLMGLYPGKQISPDLDQKFSEAAKVSLNARQDQSTGWATAHRINAWARLYDGDRALSIFRKYLLGGMTLDNLFDTHPPFQIDGNFGGTAGMAEMLLQSHLGEIHLLPALSSYWMNGEVKGLKATGDFTVDILWKSAQVEKVRVFSGSGEDCPIYYKNIAKAIVKDNDGRNIDYRKISDNEIIISTERGKEYFLEF